MKTVCVEFLDLSPGTCSCNQTMIHMISHCSPPPPPPPVLPTPSRNGRLHPVSVAVAFTVAKILAFQIYRYMYLPDCVHVNQLVLCCILFGYSLILFGFREPSFLNKKVSIYY